MTTPSLPASPAAALRPRRGRLRLYVGYAPGVGKTTRLLRWVRELRARGVDAVAAGVDCRGRAETEELLDGVEVVPPRVVAHRGLEIREMDVEAVLRRAPAACAVDDVHRANAPGSRNLRRHEDVEDLLDAGIDVAGALDVQHVESLLEVTLRAAGVVVRDVVPDAFFRRADEVVAIDLPVEDLLDRVRDGKVDPTVRSPSALGAGFRPEALAALREMALREIAETLGRAERRGGVPPGNAPPLGVSDRVLVCLASASPRAGVMLRRAARIAGRLNTVWFALHVETPAESPERIDAEAQRRLLRSVELARELGAEVAVVRAEDPVAAVLDFARSHGVAQVIVGRSGRSGVVRAFRRTFVDRLVDEADDLDVHIVAAEIPEDAR